MFKENKKIFTVVLAFFGLGIVTGVGADTIFDDKEATNSDVALNDGGNICDPTNSTYSETNENYDDRVFTAGCGGLF
jgi:hypothetical protein